MENHQSFSEVNSSVSDMIKVLIVLLAAVCLASGCGKRFVKKGKCNEYDFLQVLRKSSWTTSKAIFETLSALVACHETIIEGVVYKKSKIFEVFLVYLSEFLIFLHEIFF